MKILTRENCDEEILNFDKQILRDGLFFDFEMMEGSFVARKISFSTFYPLYEDDEDDDGYSYQYYPFHDGEMGNFKNSIEDDLESISGYVISHHRVEIFCAYIENISTPYDKSNYDKLVPIFISGMCRRYKPTCPVSTEEDYWSGLFDPISLYDLLYECMNLH